MIRTILCVCTGNLCRSPMAAALLAARLQDRVVHSVGTAAIPGTPAPHHAIALMAERGIDLASHRTRHITPALLREYDLVLAAEASHVRRLLTLAPEMRGRVFRLGHWKNFDIPDPLGSSRAHYEHCLDLIEACVDDWVSHLRPQSEARDG